MKLKLILLVFISKIFCLHVIAQQDTLLKGNFVDVVKEFKPMLSESIKIPINPNPEIPDIVKTDYAYNIPLIKFSVEPTVYTIKPLTLGTMLLPKLKGNYCKVGFGNYTTPLFETYITTVRNKNMQAGFFFNHLSANGNNNYNNFSTNNIKAYINEFADKNSYSFNVNYNRLRINRYGFENNITPEKDTIKNIYNNLEIIGGYELLGKDSSEEITRINAAYSFYNTTAKQIENNIDVYTTIRRQFQGIPVNLFGSVNNINITNNNNNFSYQRLFIRFNPEAYLNEKEFYLIAGFNAALVNDSAGTSFNFFPKAEGGFYLMPQKLTILAGIKGNIAPNTLKSITTENPFVLNPVYTNTINTFEIYGNLKGQLSKRSNFNLFSSSANINNQLFYINDTISGNQKTVYDNGSLIKSGFEIDYAVNSKFLLALSGTLYNYKLDTLIYAFTRPGFEFKLNSTYNMADKFVSKLDIFYMNQRFGLIERNNPAKMEAFSNFNFGIDYRYNKNVSAFINFNNIANNRYQLWYNYPVYGFNLLGGLTLTF